MNDLEAVFSKIENAKPLDFGSVFNACIELFKKVWVQGLVVLLLQLVLMVPLYFIIYLPFISMGLINPDFFNGSQNFNEFGGLGVISAIVLSVMVIVLTIGGLTIQIGLKAAYYKIVKNKDLALNQSDDYFFFFKKAYLKKTITLALVMILIGFLAFLLCFLPIFYALIPLSYMTVVYTFNPDLSIGEVVKVAFKLGNKKWLITFGLVLVAWVLASVVGFLMCFVGIYVTQQFINLPFYQVYKEVAGFDENNAIDEIGTTL